MSAECLPFCSGTHFTNDFFHHNSNSMENSFSSNSITVDHIATKFGTCHDSQAVVPCAKFCSDHFISTWMRAKWNFHHIRIVMAKLLVKWAPGLNGLKRAHTFLPAENTPPDPVLPSDGLVLLSPSQPANPGSHQNKLWSEKIVHWLSPWAWFNIKRFQFPSER